MIINASSCILHFHSDSSNNDFGFKLTVKAKGRKFAQPPIYKPRPLFQLLVHLKMIGMKALLKMLNCCPWIVEYVSFHFDSILSSAISKVPKTPVLTVNSGKPPELMFESHHPYEDSQDTYIPVKIPGARSIVVTFDPETRTECNCDYVIFYTDDSHNTKVPNSDTYTGGKDGSNSNWPGLKDIPPLVIDGDSFVIYFHSDGR